MAFAVSLGGNGLVKTTTGNKDLIYRDVLTNVGGAYNEETGELRLQTNISLKKETMSVIHTQRLL